MKREKHVYLKRLIKPKELNETIKETVLKLLPKTFHDIKIISTQPLNNSYTTIVTSYGEKKGSCYFFVKSREKHNEILSFVDNYTKLTAGNGIYETVLDDLARKYNSMCYENVYFEKVADETRTDIIDNTEISF